MNAVVGTDRGERIVDTGPCPNATCGNHVYLLESQYERLQETGDSFYCVAGHSLTYTAKPKRDAAKARQAELERIAEQARKRAERHEKARNEAERRCPWPTCEGRLLASPQGLRQHLVRAHGAPWATAELTTDEIGQVLNGRDPVDIILDAPAPSHRGDPSTSVEAAARPRRPQRLNVLDALAAAPDGLTGHELWASGGCGLYPSNATSRCEEWEREGLVVRTDRTRETPSGGSALVWTITEAGRGFTAKNGRA